jgi:hypothetical protein
MYAYRVGDGTHWSEWFHARTAANEPEPFSYIYFGDAQNPSSTPPARGGTALFMSIKST